MEMWCILVVTRALAQHRGALRTPWGCMHVESLAWHSTDMGVLHRCLCAQSCPWPGSRRAHARFFLSQVWLIMETSGGVLTPALGRPQTVLGIVLGSALGSFHFPP